MGNQLPFKLNLDEPLSRWRAESFWSKEPETIKWLDHFSRYEGCDVDTLVDVGANIGIYSLYWLAISKKTKVIACEPFPTNYELLKSNLVLNSMLNRTVLISKPLYSHSILGSLISEDLRPGSSGSQFLSKIEVPSLKEQETFSTTIDDLISESAKPIILKIDVDGLDFEVLKGAKYALESKNIFSILIEASETVHKEIESYLSIFHFLSDPRFNYVDSHSDARRKKDNKVERNRVYSLRDLL